MTLLVLRRAIAFLTELLTTRPVSYAWADQSYRGDLLEWAAKLLGMTIEIVKRPAEQGGFQVQPRTSVVERTIAFHQGLPTLEQGFRASRQD